MKGSNSKLLDSISQFRANLYKPSFILESVDRVPNGHKLISCLVHLSWSPPAGQFASTASSKSKPATYQVAVSTVLQSYPCPGVYPRASLMASWIISFALQALSILGMSNLNTPKTSFSLPHPSTSQGSKCL